MARPDYGSGIMSDDSAQNRAGNYPPPSGSEPSLEAQDDRRVLE
jgi:hypothetical protein